MTLISKSRAVEILTAEHLPRVIDSLRDELRNVAAELKDDDKRPIRSKEAADYLSIGRTQLIKWIKSGKIPENFVHRKAGGPYFFKHELRQCV